MQQVASAGRRRREAATASRGPTGPTRGSGATAATAATAPARTARVVAELPVGTYRLAGGRAAGRVQAGAGHVLGAGARRRDGHGHPHARAAAAAARRHERPGREAARRLLLADPRARRVRGLHRRGVRRRRRRERRHDDVHDDPPGRLRDPPNGVAFAVPPDRRRRAVRHARRREDADLHARARDRAREHGAADRHRARPRSARRSPATGERGPARTSTSSTAGSAATPPERAAPTIADTIDQSQYTLTADDLGKTLRFAVSARNEAGRAVAVSAPVDVLSLDAPDEHDPARRSRARSSPASG